MKHLAAMFTIGPYNEELLRRRAANRGHSRTRIPWGVVLCTLFCTVGATAQQRVKNSLAPLHLEINAAAISMPDAKAFSATEFRPRPHSIFTDSATVDNSSDAPMLRGTTVWQRLGDYKSHDRVRVLTLWESSASTLSLQAGKRGDPSLQWSSRWMNRGEATRGLLDPVFSAPASAGRTQPSTVRTISAQSSRKQTTASVVDLK